MKTKIMIFIYAYVVLYNSHKQNISESNQSNSFLYAFENQTRNLPVPPSLNLLIDRYNKV